MKLIIIGNGFDISLGLKTQYCYYRDWLIENDTETYSNILGLRNSISDLDEYYGDWSKLENNLFFNADQKALDILYNIIDYSKTKDDVSFDVDILKRLTKIDLIKWLNYIDINKNIDWKFPNDCIFLTFNYTQVLENVFNIGKDKILHLHGSLENNNIVFGNPKNNMKKVIHLVIKGIREYKAKYKDFYMSLDDIRNIIRAFNEVINECSKDVSRRKSTLLNFLEHKDIDEIFVYGISFGECDIEYFKELNRLLPYVRWHINLFGEGLEQIKNNLNFIKGKKEFREFDKFYFDNKYWWE